MSDPNAPRRSTPLLDGLGKLCTEGKQLSDYLWQVPKDEAAREKIVAILDQIAAQSAKQGPQGMPRICAELKTAAKTTPRPQPGDALGSGLHPLLTLWQAAQSRLL